MFADIRLICVVSILISMTATAQDPPVEWGEIPRADLEMKTYDRDSNASAVILADYGTTTMNNDLDLEFRRHLRVKVLSPRGYDLGTFDIGILVSDDIESIRDIEGVTYILKADGDVEEVEFDEDDVIVEKDVNSQVERYKFTMPGLVPGCVFEVRYTITSGRWGMIKDWTFQSTEPVRWSEYRITMPQNFQYACVYQGFEPYAVNEGRDVNVFVSGRAESYLGRKMVPGKFLRWVVQNAPAIRSEPFITTRGDYVNRVDVQLATTSFIHDGYRQYINTWQKFGEELLEYKGFGDRLDPTSTVRKISAEVAGPVNGQMAKARALHRWVLRTITWDGSYWKYSQRDLDDIISSGRGNSAEISFVLIALLRAAGITADPMLISTRSNGVIQELYPIEAQFNHVVVAASPGGDVVYVDAVNRHRPFDLPPVSVLGRKGFVVSPKRMDFVQPTTTRSELRHAESRITMNELGDVRGSATVVFKEYAASEARRELSAQDATPAKMFKSVLEGHGREWRVDTAWAVQADSLEVPLELNGTVSAEGFANVADSLIYLNPHMLYAPTESPFTRAERKFPLDYGTRQRTSSRVVVAVPAGYRVKETPSGRAISSRKGSVEFRRVVLAGTDSVVVECSLNITSPLIEAAEYPTVREVYGSVAQYMGEQLVFERQPPPAAASPAAPPAKKGTKKK